MRKKERESEYQGRRKVIKSGGGEIGSNGGGGKLDQKSGGTDRPKVVCPHQF